MFVKIYSMAMLCMIFPLLVSTFALINFSKQMMQTAANNTLETIASKEVTAMEDFISAQKVLTASVATNATIIEAGKDYQQTKTFDGEQQSYAAEYLGSMQENAKGLYENFFVTLGSEGYADCLGNTTLHDVAEEPFYQACMKDGFYFGNNISPITGNPVYVIAYAITDPITGEMLGTVNNSIDVKAMSQKMLMDDTFVIALIDMEGNIIAHKDPGQILSYNIRESDEESWQGYITAGRGAFTYFDPVTNELTYTGYAVSNNFMCQVSQTADIFTKNTILLTTTALVILIVCLFGAGMIIFVFAKRLAKPLSVANEKVASLVSDINEGHGDLSAEIFIQSKDETGQLVSSINEFLATLHRVISTVKTTSSKVKENAITTNDVIAEASESSTSISAVMEELTASMEEVSVSASDMAQSVSAILETVENVSDESNRGASLVESIRGRASQIKQTTSENKIEIITTYNTSMLQLQETVTAVAETISNVSITIGECTTGVENATENVNNLVESMVSIKSGADEDLEGIITLQDDISRFV